MATYDNKIWLLKNIRNAFIATDDTGLCEIVMAGENFSKIFRASQTNTTDDLSKSKSDDEDDRDKVTQFDPYPDMEDSESDTSSSGGRYEDFGGHRHRSNTAQWLDKKEQALKKQAKIKVIKWENPPTDVSAEEIAEVFPKVEVKKLETKKSLLSEQLEKCPELPHRQYLEYAKFDGTAQLGLPTKSFKIFMTMLSEKHQNYPLVVCVIANAKIKDLIGFTCYKYSIEHPDITLGSVHDYGLCIAEDDGEVDWAFPCLDSNEPCSKFGFTCLGLVELKNKNVMNTNSAGFSVNDDERFQIFSGAFSGFPKATESGHSVNNTSRHNTGGSATSETVRNALKAVNEERRAAGDVDLDKIQSHIMAADAPQYKTYRVQMLRKVRSNTPVQLGISLDRIEIEPLVPNKHAFWSRSKYFLHSIDSVAWCQIMEAKTNKTTFRIVYSPSHNHNTSFSSSSGNAGFFHPNSTYKVHDFESDHDVAREIVEKVNTILDLRNSPCRREYKSAKEKKLQTRRSFHTKHLS